MDMPPCGLAGSSLAGRRALGAAALAGRALASLGPCPPDLREAEEEAALRALPLVLALRGATPTASYSLRRSQLLLLDLVALPYTSCAAVQPGRGRNGSGRQQRRTALQAAHAGR